MSDQKEKSEKRIDQVIGILQVYVQALRKSSLQGEFIIDGMILDKIPVNSGIIKHAIRNELIDALSKEINRLQVIRENDGDLPEEILVVLEETVGDGCPQTPRPIIRLEDAVYYLLTESYFGEFEIIDKLSQHPRGLNFENWLRGKKLTKN